MVSDTCLQQAGWMAHHSAHSNHTIHLMTGIFTVVCALVVVGIAGKRPEKRPPDETLQAKRLADLTRATLAFACLAICLIKYAFTIQYELYCQDLLNWQHYDRECDRLKNREWATFGCVLGFHTLMALADLLY